MERVIAAAASEKNWHGALTHGDDGELKQQRWHGALDHWR
jgi:hypothetical protein